jgi:hypothetical protein
MKRIIQTLSLGSIATFCLLSCARNPAPPSTASFPDTARRLQADVSFLASDALEGRGTPSRGLDLAALYLETQMRLVGIEPAASNSYLQTYKIGEYTPADSRLSVRINQKPIPAQDYLFLNIGRDPAQGPMDLELVFVGQGVVAEERKVHDLDGLDLRGKAAVAQKGASWPLEPSQVFGPDRALGKLMAATIRGAQLLVYLSEELDLSTEAEAGFFREMKNAPVGFIREPAMGPASALNPILVLKPRALAAALGTDLERLSKGPMGSRIQIVDEAKVNEGVASNVLGKIAGSDPSLKDEWLVLSAHYDHLGSHTVPAGQDGIWNGADDNASGTAAVLEIARRLAQHPGKRSVLIFFTSGEDRGIFGSAYYGAHPIVPMERVVVQINLDMVGRSQGRVEAIASCAPGLFTETAELGKKHNIEVLPDQQPTWRLVYLTDVYHFAKSGVPGVEFFTGFHPDYHQPGDTAEKIRYEEMSRITDIAFDLARAYVDGRTKPAFVRPGWFMTP